MQLKPNLYSQGIEEFTLDLIFLFFTILHISGSYFLLKSNNFNFISSHFQQSIQNFIDAEFYRIYIYLPMLPSFLYG